MSENTENQAPAEPVLEAAEKELSEVEQIRVQLDEANDKYVRLLAESENTRKRMINERKKFEQLAQEKIVCDLLKPIDSLSVALGYTQNMSPEVQNWALGFTMILGQMKDVLADHGVRAFSSVGETFDPYRHEAIEMIETDAAQPGSVIEECSKGYMMADRVIRVASVKVAKAKTSETGDNHDKQAN